MAFGTCDYPECEEDATEENLSTGRETCPAHHDMDAPHHLKSFHWKSSDGWRSNEWALLEGHPIPSTLLDNLRNGWMLVATLNSGQKVRLKCRS